MSVCEAMLSENLFDPPCLLPSPKGSLLNVVLDDYLRLKKLFAARLVNTATSQGDESSVTEVGSCLHQLPSSSSHDTAARRGFWSPFSFHSPASVLLLSFSSCSPPLCAPLQQSAGWGNVKLTSGQVIIERTAVLLIVNWQLQQNCV